MFYYIYKLKNAEENVEEKLNDSPNVIDGLKFRLIKKGFINIDPKIDNYKFKDQKEVDGNVIIDEEGYKLEIPFKLRSKSGFVFIQTDLQGQKNKAAKYLNSLLEQKLENFIPLDSNENNLIWHVGKLNHAKFFFKDDIVTDEEIDEDICKDTLDEDCTLFEASIDLVVNKHKVPMYYYGDAIQFPESVKSEDRELAIQTFENVMSET